MMKNLLLILTLVLAACGEKKQDSNDDRMPASIVNNPYSADGMDMAAAGEKPVMAFSDTLHNFGNIKADEIVTYEFSFTNTGKTPLLITSASGSCGCTVADYPHEPVSPGQAGTMKVTFDSKGKTGHQEKSVSIQTNTVRSTHMLYIQAEVAEKK